MTTKEQVIAMAREAGLFTHKEVQPEIIRFAKLVGNAKLEEAARIAEGYPKYGDAIAEEIRNLKDKS